MLACTRGENDLQWNHKLNSASPPAADCWESQAPVFREAAAKPVQSGAATREAKGNLELFQKPENIGILTADLWPKKNAVHQIFFRMLGFLVFISMKTASATLYTNAQ